MLRSVEELHGSASSGETPIDWVAFAELQRLRSSSFDTFSLNCLEDACDRLLKTPDRCASGIKLAGNLYHDSRKNSRLLRTKHIPIGDNTEIRSEDLDPRQQIEFLEQEQETSELVSRALDQLPTRKRLAIELKFKDVPMDQATTCLGVGERQFRNLLREGLQDVQAYCQRSGGAF